MNIIAASAKINEQNQNNVKVLRNGSSVLVRILQDRGNGSYEGSVAGVRVNLKAQKALVSGESFVANVDAKNGQIKLVPADKNLLNFSELNLTVVNKESIQNLLNSLGIAAEPLNEHIVLQMKQLGMRLDREAFSTIKNLSVKFGKNQKKAAEIITLLKHKSLVTDEKVIQFLMKLLEDDNQTDENQTERALFCLKLFNHKSGWIFIPYEIIQNKTKEVLGNGTIKLLLSDGIHIKRMNVNVKFKSRDYYFSLGFENKICNDIKFNVNPSDSSKIDSYKKLFNSYLKKIMNKIPEAEWADKEEVEGTACNQEEILRIGGLQ